MSCLSNSSPDNAVDDLLNGAQWVLDTAGNILSVASPIPGLQVAVSTLSGLIGIILKTRGNQDTRKGLAESIAILASVIEKTANLAKNAVGEQGSEPGAAASQKFKSSPEIEERIQALIKKLGSLSQDASRLGDESFLFRCIRSGRNEATLASIKEGIGEATSHFQVQGQITMEMLLNGLVEKVDKVDDKVKIIKLTQEDELHEKALETLSYVNAGFSSSLNPTTSGVLQGTRIDLLNELMQWAGGNSSGSHDPLIYVLSGGAGTGKSTVAFEMATRLQDENLLGASFFFVRGSEKLSTTNFVIPTIAYQLARSQADLYPVIVEAARAYVRAGKQNQQLEFDLEDLLIKPLSTVSATHRRVVIVFDALDECTENAQNEVVRLLYLFLRRLPEIPFPLRILLTTRPEMHIEEALNSTEFRNISKPFKLHDIPRTIVDADITLFLQIHLQNMSWGKELLEERPNTISDLANHAAGLFIYAATVIQFLRRDTDHALETLDALLIENPSEGSFSLLHLDKLYLTVLGNAFSEQDLSHPQAKRWIQTVLGSVALLQDRLTPQSLEELTGISAKDIRYTLRRLRSVISLPEDANSEIRPLHASFPQFLLDNNRCDNPLFFIDPVAHNTRLATACLTLLKRSGILRENICRIRGALTFKNSVHDLRDRIKKHIPPHVQYACAYWTTHLCQGEATPDLLRLLSEFLTTKLLVWFEVMSLINRLDEAASALQNIRNWYRANAGPLFSQEIHQLINDGFRLALEFFVPINACVEQLYISALQLIPSGELTAMYSSSINRRYSVKLLTDRDSQWGSCLRVIEGHTDLVTTGKFSSDRKWIVSGGSDRTVRLWDATSGICLKIMTGHTNRVTMVDFSPNNRKIVSASYDSNINIWDAASGATLQVFSTKRGIVHSSIFSRDGSQVLSISSHLGLQMWDIRREKEVKSRKKSRSVLHSLDISSDGALAVTSSPNNNICIWDTVSGELKKTMSANTDQPNGAIFVHDDRMVVSCSNDKTLRIWDVASGTCTKVLEGHTAEVTCVAVSPDGALIASSSNYLDRSIRLWDTTTWEVVGVLLGHTDAVLSCSFSPDGSRLLSASVDHTLRVWDLTQKRTRSAIEHRAAITSVSFSPDGGRVASTSADAVRVWDSQGQQIRMFEGNIAQRGSVIFSPSGRTLVCTAGEDKIKVWDIESGALLHTLEGMSKDAQLVAYSPDGQCIASGASDTEPKITLWAASDGTLLRKLEVDFSGPQIEATEVLEFSPDSSKIYLRSTFNYECILDCLTGESLDVMLHRWELASDKGEFREIDGWIEVKNSGENLCWLPGVKRGESNRASASFKNLFAVGASSGQFSILDLSALVQQ